VHIFKVNPCQENTKINCSYSCVCVAYWNLRNHTFCSWNLEIFPFVQYKCCIILTAPSDFIIICEIYSIDQVSYTQVPVGFNNSPYFVNFAVQSSCSNKPRKFSGRHNVDKAQSEVFSLTSNFPWSKWANTRILGCLCVGLLMFSSMRILSSKPLAICTFKYIESLSLESCICSRDWYLTHHQLYTWHS